MPHILLLLLSAVINFAHGIGYNTSSLFLNPGFTSDMVLQRGPAQAAIYGLVVPSSPGVIPSVTVTLDSGSGSPLVIKALIDVSVVKGGGTECDALCIKNSMCTDTGSSSACALPSCSFGCLFAAHTASYQDCTAMCNKSTGCSFDLDNWELDMCGGFTNDVCSGGCGSFQQCYAGCAFSFNKPAPSLAYKALLPPQAAGGSFTISVACTSGCLPVDEGVTIQLERVTFGDVFFCSGQSVSVCVFILAMVFIPPPPPPFPPPSLF